MTQLRPLLSESKRSGIPLAWVFFTDQKWGWSKYK